MLCEVQHDGAGPIRYRYNREGHLIEVHNERGQVHRFVRSLAGHVIREELMDGRTHDFRRDLFGRLTKGGAAPASWSNTSTTQPGS